MFQSILFQNNSIPHNVKKTSKETIIDLHLDQLFSALQEETRVPIEDYLMRPLSDPKTIQFRQDIFRDLEKEDLLQSVTEFVDKSETQKLFVTRIERIYEPEVKWYELLTTLRGNLKALRMLKNALEMNGIKSTGLSTLNQYLRDYLARNDVLVLSTQVESIYKALQSLNYRVLVNGLKITIEETDGFADGLNEHLQKTFASLLGTNTHTVDYSTLKEPEGERGLSNLQARILKSLAKVFPTEFGRLHTFYDRYITYLDPVIDNILMEFNFYLAVQKFEAKVARRYEVTFCYPDLDSKVAESSEFVRNSFDLALTTVNPAKIISNDFEFKNDEQFLLVSGPNQGGKTTFARMVGEVYFLTNLGIPVPGTTAKLQIKTKILTHFERQENEQLLTGLLAADVDRIYDIVSESDQQTLVIMNELFSSTTMQDAEIMGIRVLEKLIGRGTKGVYVSFLDQLEQVAHTATMMSQIIPDSTQRTFKVVRSIPNGNAYALSLLAQYNLTAKQIEGGNEDES